VISQGLLGDTEARDYSAKLSQFNSFAEPELRGLIRHCALTPGMQVLDAGCGTGEALNWLLQQVSPSGDVVGMDLSAAHVAAARRRAPSLRTIQANLLDAVLAPESFDFIWCVNTINHLSDPMAGVLRLAALLRQDGRVALGQSSFLPEMFFAWDARLERVTNEAVRRYYRDRYHLEEEDLAAVRALVGLLRKANLKEVTSRTVMIERVSPLDAATETYLRETIMRDTWGQRLRPYMSEDDFGILETLCNPAHADYALRRPDFHFLQTFTLVSGRRT
jgi:SAM-dependent methyltransferase